MSDEDILPLIKKGDTRALKEFYVAHRTSFLEFGKKYSSSEEDILDVYQDAIIVFQEQTMIGKTDNLTCTLKTYLFGIGKYMLFEKNRKSNKEYELPNNLKEEIEMIIVEDDSTVNLQQRKIQEGLKLLGKKCREILTLFYYNNLTIDEIKEYLKYENKNVVKSQKSRCLKQLKSKING